MLNEKNLESILHHDLPPLTIKDIHWRAQDADAESLLFYRLSDAKSEDLFHERCKTTNFAWLIVNRRVSHLPANASVIPEDQWPEIQKQILDKLYPLPKLKLMAVTGTNGKTTTADLVLQLGELVGKKGISIGTLGVRENGKTLIDFGLTSAAYIDLRKFLYTYGKGKDFCVLEASSHALMQQRLYDLKFDGVGWLSFSQDHLDYHGSMDAYFEAKCLIMKQLTAGAKLFVPEERQDLYHELKKRFPEITKTAKIITGKLPLFFRTRFNQNNLEVAKAMVEDVFGLKVPEVFENIHAPDGRFYIRPYGSNYIVVDFAHTPDALENICLGLREAFPKHHFTILFGCGGDRDRTKRPKMGEVASRLADEIYVTSDNPRSEDPELIIQDILAGIKHKNIHVNTLRPEAVREALNKLQQNELLLLAGKGHEDYILIKGVKHPYSDIKEVDEFLSRKGL